MVQRQSKAVWNGTLKEGNGTFQLGKTGYEGKYSFPSRFEDGSGTNPEELIASAHAACYSMALSAGLEKAGFKAEKVTTEAVVSLEKVGEGFEITKITLEVEAVVPGVEESKFNELVEGTKTGCPISKALSSVKTIEVNAKLLATA